jgi:hypothetical protein
MSQSYPGIHDFILWGIKLVGKTTYSELTDDILIESPTINYYIVKNSSQRLRMAQIRCI